jgi:hypothetical protein
MVTMMMMMMIAVEVGDRRETETERTFSFVTGPEGPLMMTALTAGLLVDWPSSSLPRAGARGVGDRMLWRGVPPSCCYPSYWTGL